jgi:hypothetical protein
MTGGLSGNSESVAPDARLEEEWKEAVLDETAAAEAGPGMPIGKAECSIECCQNGREPTAVTWPPSLGNLYVQRGNGAMIATRLCTMAMA